MRFIDCSCVLVESVNCEKVKFFVFFRTSRLVNKSGNLISVLSSCGSSHLHGNKSSNFYNVEYQKHNKNHLTNEIKKNNANA